MEHSPEPFNFNWQGGIPDVFAIRLALDGSIRIDQWLVLRIKKNKERDTARFSTKIGYQFGSARAIQFRVLAPFFERMKGSEDKVLFQDRTNFPIVHEGFHFPAWLTPGGSEYEKDELVLRNSF